MRLPTYIFATFATLFSASSAPVAYLEEDILFLDNSTLKIGTDRAKGASITFLSWENYPRNAVNIYDPGRLIQQSYYAGNRLDRTAEGQSKSWSPWSWNPIQGGGVGSWARVTSFERRDGGGTLFSETVPKLWDMPDEEAAAVMRQWTAFEPGMPSTVVVRCQLAASRTPGDRWGSAVRSPQEIPATYFTRNFDTFMSYLGGGAWRTEPTKIGPPWGSTKAPRNAMACFDASGQGIAIFSPAAETWNYGPHAGGGTSSPLGGPCVHIAPVATAPLGPRSTYTFRYWITTGTATEIAASLDSLWKNYADEPAVLTDP